MFKLEFEPDIKDKLMPLIKPNTLIKMEEEWTKGPIDITAEAMFQINEEGKIVKTCNPKIECKLKEVDRSVYDRYNDDLVITYGIDGENSISSLIVHQLTEYKLDKSKLLSIAKKNLQKRLGKVEVKIFDNLAEIRGNNYVASLILRPDMLKKMISPLKGDLYFIPLTQHYLLICKDKARLDSVFKNINEDNSVFKHFITRKSFPIKV